MFTFKTHVVKSIADTHTPVQLYYQLRDRFPNALLLESSDYKSIENSYSYICLDAIASFIVYHDHIEIQYPNGDFEQKPTETTYVPDLLNDFISQFHSEVEEDFNFKTSGFFGYTSYDALPLFGEIDLENKPADRPLIHYQFFRSLLIFDHFHNQLYIAEQKLNKNDVLNHDEIIRLMRSPINSFGFNTLSDQTSNFTDEFFLDLIHKGIKHCLLGDVFQLVLSRKFCQKFQGDDFNVYRALRSINPSPYLFYFDYGDYKVFGSSPEAQLVIQEQQAQINPIAGTFKRTGNYEEDVELGIRLSQDPKEVAEHMMLVDLARNDLGKNASNVKVESYKQVEFYSHVIHLVSKVRAQLKENYNPITILGDSYPAGTLSGAPKHRAMQLIDTYETESRGFYGGAIGYIGLDKSFNHAIFIRSFVSENHQLHFQAGCGIVAKSNPTSELQEVYNKVSALNQAIQLAKTI